jgi:hypothetical protein
MNALGFIPSKRSAFVPQSRDYGATSKSLNR